MLTVDLVRAGARRWGARPALTYRDRTLSFADVDGLASRMANALIAGGVRPGTRVAILADNGPYSLSIDFACLKARATRVPLNARLSSSEHARMLAESGATVLLYTSSLADRAAELLAAADAVDGLSVGPAPHGHPDLLVRAQDGSARDPLLAATPDDVVLALFTSGTTGTLKAAQHTQATYAAVCANILANLVSPGRDDAMLHAASLIHASGTFVLPFWLRGARAVVLDGLDPDAYLEQVRATGATHANLVPTMITMLLERGGDADLGRLRSMVYGASPMPRATLERALATWGPILTQYYGQTEAPLCLAVLDAEDHVGDDVPYGAAGQPAVDVELRLVDADGRDVADGEVGEIAVRGPIVHAGYLDAPELDAAVRMPDGFMRTRDLGRRDERGFLHLEDRTSDMIVTGGYNVYPREVEEALVAHPDVVEAAVVGGPDPTWVEAVTAFVRVRQGAEVDAEALRSHVRGRVAGYKVPKRVELVDDLPKSAVGKVLRRALRDPLWADHDGGGR
ncbi:AMP-binding protein [Patulibacter sp. SYSU D01012]|uniref:class I adenylate-forming enzyme family protein n=1 Tax=Patulibacter sp. SYSU D01012 TaxID=2817381 RepID=UPI001B3111E7|nr:AMP-binding protein [Patulibacter sp. SYSU D01012]